MNSGTPSVDVMEFYNDKNRSVHTVGCEVYSEQT